MAGRTGGEDSLSGFIGPITLMKRLVQSWLQGVEEGWERKTHPYQIIHFIAVSYDRAIR
jgi:hypothetical protein